MKAIGYVRVSTEEQATEGVSLAAQAEKIRAYCALKGIELADVVIDAGVSAGKPLACRPGGARIAAAVARGEVAAVIGLKLDRLFRDAADCLTVTREWERAGVAFHIIDLGGNACDTTSASGRFMLTVLAGAAEMERNLIRERTAAAMAHLKARGDLLGAAPLGRDLVTDSHGRRVAHAPNAAEAATVERIRELAAAGKSTRAIAAILTAERRPTKRGGTWASATVAKILRREVA